MGAAAKVRITASLKEDLVDWMDKEIDKRRFASRSHALEYAMTQLKDADSLKLTN